jgi:hydroxymethylglutaryl-CoA reductase (NADPH)
MSKTKVQIDTKKLAGAVANVEVDNRAIAIPLKWVGPVKVVGTEFNFVTTVPLATLEKPLWPSVSRGARLTKICGGLHATVVRNGMARSVVVQAHNAHELVQVEQELVCRKAELDAVVAATSGYATLQDWQSQIIGNLLYLRFNFAVGDAAGHNMATKAADALLDWLLMQYPQLKYVSISGNYCVDKKVSAVNGILGRGKHVVVEMTVPHEVCVAQLRVTPAQLVDLHIKKNLLGSIIAGSICSANAHAANMLLAFYLATGQDGANIVEGSQAIVHAELCGQNNMDLYFSVTLPNIIVGTVGSGKDLVDFVSENLKQLGCGDVVGVGYNARKLAVIAASAVWCGEISLLAAQANRGELVRSHEEMERRKPKCEGYKK